MEIDEIDSNQPGHVQRVISKFEELLLQRIEVKEEVCDEETSDIDVPSTQKDTNNEANKSAESTNCSLCTLNGEHRAASCFCTSCEIPEPLCDECSRHHIRQRNMRDHSLSTDIKAFITYLENNVINCELCLLDGEQRAATSFCLTCKEPEALCKDCAAQHIKQKAFRSHQITNDRAKLPKKKKLLCEPCTTEGAKTRADSFCKDCDEPEPLCKNCAVEHIKQRQFRNHSICGDISQIPLKQMKILEFYAPYVRKKAQILKLPAFVKIAMTKNLCATNVPDSIRDRNFSEDIIYVKIYHFYKL
ncbi:uncharacterized protein LOC134283381 [Saccostrea cucullata]|uniref:uncharacterized protein LOC134283381 n=1 Tax=Saccostrea cuccullata TaxID=36930 RepID=UPI002ED27F8A